MNWTFEYEKQGGYDCMTGAFIIRYKGKEVALVDQHDFGQHPFPCEYKEFPEARAMAQFIVDACNEKESNLMKGYRI